MKTIKTFDQWNQEKNKSTAVAFYCYSEDCSVCEVLLPKLRDLLQEEFPKLDLVLVDLKDTVDITEELQIYTVPVLIVYFDGNEQFRKIRVWGIDELKADLVRPYRLMFD